MFNLPGKRPIAGHMKEELKQTIKEILGAWAQDPAGASAKPVALPSGLDSSVVCDLLLAHHLQVLAEPFLAEEDQTPAFREGLASARDRTAFLLLELERIMPVVAWADCRPVVLKGGSLSVNQYARPDQRWFLDLDILVPRGQVDAVCERLESVGYTPFDGNRDPLFYERHHLHRMMVGPQGSCVEVHWDLTLPTSIYGFDVAGVFNRAKEQQVGRVKMLAASPVDQVLHLVYQNIADGFLDLKRVCDLFLLVQGLEKEEKLYLVKESLRTRMNIGLWLSLHMVKSVFGVDSLWPGTETLAPGWATNRTLRGLDVEDGIFIRRADHLDGYASLIHFMMVPKQEDRWRETQRFVWIDEAELLDRGHRVGELPGWGPRFRLSLFLLKTYLVMSGRAVAAFVHG